MWEPAKKKLKIEADVGNKYIEGLSSQKCLLDMATPKTLFASLIKNSMLTPENFLSDHWENVVYVMKNNEVLQAC